MQTKPKFGNIQLTLQYNPTMNVMSGILIKATGLKRMDVIGLSGVCVCVCACVCVCTSVCMSVCGCECVYMLLSRYDDLLLQKLIGYFNRLIN